MDTKNILVSFILISYNQEKYIEDALLSVLNQNYKNLQIIVSDDASTDHTKSIISKYASNHDFLFLNHKKNQGLIGNLNSAFSFAQGEIIVVMAGDDISETNRVTAIVDCFVQHPNVYCIYSNTKDIDLNGNELQNSSYGFKYHTRNGTMNLYKHLFNDLGILGCSAAYRKCLIEHPLPTFLPSEDKILTMRALMKGDIMFLHDKLVKYRLGSGISNNLNKKNQAEYKKIIQARIKTIDGYISELKIDAIYKNKISFLIIQKAFLESVLDIFENKKNKLPSGFFDVKNITIKDKLRFIFYRYFTS